MLETAEISAAEQASALATPLIASLADLQLSPDRIVEFLTILLGSAGIAELLYGSKKYDQQNYKAGTTHVGIGNGLLFSTALIGEMIRLGMPGMYSFAEIPFLISALNDLSKNVTMFGKLKAILQRINWKDVVALNAMIHGILIWTGKESAPSQLITAAGFSIASTAFFLPAGNEVPQEKAEHAQNVRRISIITGITTLAIGSIIPSLESLPDFVQSGDIKTLAVLPTTWAVLNLSFLIGEVKMLVQRLGGGKLMMDGVDRFAEKIAPPMHEDHPEYIVNAFECFMH